MAAPYATGTIEPDGRDTLSALWEAHRAAAFTLAEHPDDRAVNELRRSVARCLRSMGIDPGPLADQELGGPMALRSLSHLHRRMRTIPPYRVRAAAPRLRREERLVRRVAAKLMA